MNPQNYEVGRLSETALELTRLIGKKELTFGCYIREPNGGYTSRYVREEDDEENESFSIYDDQDMGFIFSYQEGFDWIILGHKPDIGDFHRWMNEKKIMWSQGKKRFFINKDDDIRTMFEIPYDSSKNLLPAYEGAHCQSEETLKQIVELVKSNQ